MYSSPRINCASRNKGGIVLLCFAVCLTVSGCAERLSPKKPAVSPIVQRNNSPNNPQNDPRQLLQQTVEAYRNAQTYSDRGEVQVVGKMSDPAEEMPHWDCIVCWERPGKLRLEISDGKFVSDGSNCFAQIRSLPGQVLYSRTPEHWTLETLFQDACLDRATQLGIPQDILRFAPQLILLFDEQPLRTLLPDDAVAELLEPQKIGDVNCDLIRVAHRQGTWILWLNRQNHALVRFEYLVEGLAVAPGVESIRLLRIDMPDADFNRNIAPEAFQMAQPPDARQVSAFQPLPGTELPPSGAADFIGRYRETPALSLPREHPPQSAFSPKTFQLKEKWKQPLLGTENITVVKQEILVPCEGNLLATLDASGKIVQKIQPKGFREDELLTRIRTIADGDGKRYIGVSSIGSRSVRLFDEKWVPLPLPMLVQEPSALLAKPGVVSDFQFVRFPNGTLAVLTGLLSLDSERDDVLRLTSLNGQVLWRDASVLSPFLVHSYTRGDKQGVLMLSVQETQSLLIHYDMQGTQSGTVPFAAGREILWFSVPEAVLDDVLDICVIHSDREGRDVQLAGLTLDGNLLWEQPLPSGEYQKPIDQIVMGDLLGDAAAEILVPLPDGTVYVFDRRGTLLDKFSFGRFLTGLGVMKTDLGTLLIVADTEAITAFARE